MGLHRISIQKSFKSNLANLFSNCFDFAENAAMQNFKTIWANDENVMVKREFGISSHLPPGQNGRYFANDIFICIFVNETFFTLIKI